MEVACATLGDLLRSKMVLPLSSNRLYVPCQYSCLCYTDEFRNGKEKVTAATSVGVANEDLPPSQPLTGKAVFISLHFRSGQ